MRRTHFPTLVLTGLLAAAGLAGCGEQASEPTSNATATDTASSTASAKASTSSEPSALATHGRKSDNITLQKPAEGATVSGSFTASGTANSNEANVPWQILDADGNEVASGFSTAEGWMDKLYPWQTQVDVSKLDPGTYAFIAMTSDPSGGTEGRGSEKVSATIVVE